MFLVLIKATYGTWINKNGSLKMPPGKVVMRLFTNVQDVSAQIEIFQTVIEKSKYYCYKSLDLKGVVFVSDMDKIASALCTFFGMILYWDTKYVN
jgi:hypothetical protein